MRVAQRHHCTDVVERGVVAQRHDAPRQPENFGMLWVVLEQLLEHRVELQDSEVEVEARPQPHDIRRVLELQGGSPPLLQGSDAAVEKICANRSYSKPGKPEA